MDMIYDLPATAPATDRVSKQEERMVRQPASTLRSLRTLLQVRPAQPGARSVEQVVDQLLRLHLEIAAQ